MLALKICCKVSAVSTVDIVTLQNLELSSSAVRNTVAMKFQCVIEALVSIQHVPDE